VYEKMAAAEKDGNFFKAEEKLSAGESFKLFLWNPRTKEFMGRTGSSWIKILIFYIIFYLCLAVFWAVMLWVFYQTIDQRYPKWQGDSSRIGSNPGLGFRPRPPSDKVDSTLIWFSMGENGNWQHWRDDLKDFLEPYRKSNSPQIAEHVVGECTPEKPPADGKFCLFDIRNIPDTCGESNDFGYKVGTPCVLIKLNRIYGWTPSPYGSSDTPSDMPQSLKDIANGTKVYLSCEGENPADKENIGPVAYYPAPGIENYYFPFTNQPGYLSPFVMVQFLKPTSGVLINIECKAWAKNIKHDRMDREGSVHFELLID